MTTTQIMTSVIGRVATLEKNFIRCSKKVITGESKMHIIHTFIKLSRQKVNIDRCKACGCTISQLASKTNAESRPDNAAVIKSYIEFVKQDPLPIRFPKEHKRLRVGQTAFDREVLDCIDELLHLGQYMIKQQSCAMIDDDMGRK